MPFTNKARTYIAANIVHTIFSEPKEATNIIGIPIKVRNIDRLAAGVSINLVLFS